MDRAEFERLLNQQLVDFSEEVDLLLDANSCHYCGGFIDDTTGIVVKTLVKTLDSEGNVKSEEIKDIFQCIDVKACREFEKESWWNDFGAEDSDELDDDDESFIIK